MTKRVSKAVKSAETERIEAEIRKLEEEAKKSRERDRREVALRPSLNRAAFEYLEKDAEARGDEGLAAKLNEAREAVREKVEADANKRAGAARTRRANEKKKTSTSTEPTPAPVQPEPMTNDNHGADAWLGGHHQQ